MSRRASDAFGLEEEPPSGPPGSSPGAGFGTGTGFGSGPPPGPGYGPGPGPGYGPGPGPGYATGYGGDPGTAYPSAGYGQGYGQGYGYPAPMPQTEKGATTALVLGCVSIVFCQIILGPAAIIEGRKAQRRIDESNGTLTGRGMATAGVVLGCIAVALFLFYIAVAVLSASSNPRLR